MVDPELGKDVTLGIETCSNRWYLSSLSSHTIGNAADIWKEVAAFDFWVFNHEPKKGGESK